MILEKSRVHTGWDGDTQRQLRQRVRRRLIFYVLLTVASASMFALTLSWGSVEIPLSEVIRILIGQATTHDPWATIVLDLRLPRAITAILAGAALGVSGLQMQTLFRNALADPYILGISSGATLGVAIVVLSAGAASGGMLAGIGMIRNIGIVVAAAIGSATVLGLMLLIASRVRSTVIVLIVGVMVGAFVSAFVSVLMYFSTPESLRTFALWGFGTFQGVTWGQLGIFAPTIFCGLGVAFFTSKQLNALLLGEAYARSMGLSVTWMRIATMVSASMLAGAVTAYCGPIAFVGIAVPHLARGLFRTSDHKVLVPASLLLGVLFALVCGLFAELPGSSNVLPLNAATALLGAPVVVWVLLRLGRSSEALAL